MEAFFDIVPTPYLVFITIWSSILFIFKEKLISFAAKVHYDLRKRFSSDKEIEIQAMKSLKKHDIFSVIEDVRSMVDLQKFYTHKEFDETKTQMFQDFMNFKLDSIKDHYLLIIDEAHKCESDQELKVLILNTVRYCVQEYINQTKDLFLSKGIAVRDVDYVIDTFETWRMPTVKALQDRVNSIFSSNFHKSKYKKVLATFEVTSVAIELIPRDGVASFDQINGKFKEIKY